MLDISMTEIRKMEARALEAFLSEMEAWAAAHHGPRVAALPPGAVRAEALRARALGFGMRGHARRWLALGFELGLPLAAAGRAGALAADARMSPAARLELLERGADPAARAAAV
ncbi:hypothetical protein ACQ5SO_10400 [Rhodovulum sp. DZ06]|uniref:hypothetical protein n=1 Tax=Rhodovulum sp. DZ06 TaxID=3425126 RepID=UPI003D34D9BB